MYYKKSVTPQFSDTNGAGHIDHLAYADWFDRVRVYLYREMDPTLKFFPRGLVVVTTTVFYRCEASVLEDVEIRVWVKKIGRKSFEVQQDAWQRGRCCAQCRTVFCGFNRETRASEVLSDEYRAVLEKYLWHEDIED